MRRGLTKRVYLFGYRISDPDDVGYVSASADGFKIVRDRKDATGFEPVNERGVKGWGSPEQWLGFFSDEFPEWRLKALKFVVPDPALSGELPENAPA